MRHHTVDPINSVHLRRVVVSGIGAIALASLAALIWSGAANASPPDTLTAAAQPPWLGALRTVDSLHVVADARIRIWDARELIEAGAAEELRPGEEVLGSYESLSLGSKYRIYSFVDPEKLPGMTVQVAYDGKRFQVLLDETLSISHAGDRTWALSVLPDPVLQLLQIHYPLSDENAAAVLRLKDIQQQPPELALPWSQTTWGSSVARGEVLRTAAFPGAQYEGRPYWFRVWACDELGEQIRQIDRYDDRGVLTTTHFADYQPVPTRNGSVLLPHRVELELFSPPGRLALTVILTVSELRADVELPNEVFTIDPALAQRVWDDDTGVFLNQ